MPTTVWPVRKRPTCSLPCCQVAKDDNGKKLRMKFLVAKEKGVCNDMPMAIKPPFPTGSPYQTFTITYLRLPFEKQPNVGKYCMPYMDPMGLTFN